MTAKRGFKKSAAEMFIDSPAAENTQREAAAPDDFKVPAGYRLVREKKAIRLQLMVQERIKDAIKRQSEIEGISMNELVGSVLEKYLEEKGAL